MKRFRVLLAASAFGIFLMSSQISAQDFTIGSTLEDFTLKDTAGTARSLETLKGKRGTVLVFLSAQCPVVRGYNDRINAIYDDYSQKGFSFVGINSNVTENEEMVGQHAKLHYKFPVLIDSENKIADKLRANYTPEIFFFDANKKLAYHGAIDDDRTAKKINANYLRTAFDEILSGKTVSLKETRAFGCTIKRSEK